MSSMGFVEIDYGVIIDDIEAVMAIDGLGGSRHTEYHIETLLHSDGFWTMTICNTDGDVVDSGPPTRTLNDALIALGENVREWLDENDTTTEH